MVRNHWKMRSRQIVFACFDVLFLALAWYATLHLRLFFNRLLPMQFTYRTLETVAAPLPVIVIIWMMAALWLRLYSKKTVASVWRCLASVVEAAVVTGSLIAVQAFLMRDFGVTQSRSFVVVFVPLSILTVDIGRFLAWLFALSMQKRWGLTERVAMIGGIQEIHQRFRHSSAGRAISSCSSPA